MKKMGQWFVYLVIGWIRSRGGGENYLFALDANVTSIWANMEEGRVEDWG